ncbi:MAG: LamG-like jellyroll fold domain-containing protein [Putridiphycobacter sp.]
MKNNFKKLMLLLGLTTFGLISKAQNNVINFDGVDDYVGLDSLGSALSGDNSFTIEFWMKADKNAQTSSIRTSLFSVNPSTSNGNGLLILLGGLNSQTGQLLIYDEGSWGTQADLVSNTIIGDNVCHHIAYVRDGNTGYVYIDGNLEGSHSSSYTLSPSDLISLGQEWDNLTTSPSTSQFYNGDLDDFRVWNIARTQTEIQNNMNNELVGNESGLVVYYNFNQGVAGGNNTSITSVINSTSFSGLNGDIYNMSLNGQTSNFVENGCKRPSGLEEISTTSLHIYPNPANSILNIEFSGTVENSQILIFDLSGKIVKSFNSFSGDKFQIEVSDLMEGVYYIQVINNNTVVSQRKFVKI